MKALPALPCVLFLLAACGAPGSADCYCLFGTATGTVSVACGASYCDGVGGYVCSKDATVVPSPAACLGTVSSSCTPKSCAASTCGDQPDGCGGTLRCGGCAAGSRCNAANACEPLCASVTCGGGQRCDPSTGACVGDACAQVGAVCGAVNGTTCGTCPAGSTCAGTKKACVQPLATVPVASGGYVTSTALLGDRLYVAASPGSGSWMSLYEVTLGTGQTRQVPGTVRSPLAQNGSELFFTDEAGARRLTPGSTTSTAIPGMGTWCNSLLVAGQKLYCGIGGDARYGVSGFGVKQLPLAGGTATWLKSYLNYPHLAAAGQYVFYVGTTDNTYSFANLGAVDTTNGQDQVVVSGGALDSKFVMADAQAFYFVRHAGSTSTLVRTRYEAAQGDDVLTGRGIFTDTTVLDGANVYTITAVDGVDGLWRVPVASPASKELLLGKADMGPSTYGPSHLHRAGAEWVFVSGASVYRAFTPAN